MGDDFTGEDNFEGTPPSDDAFVDTDDSLDDPNSVQGLKKAVVAERRKRQGLEERLAGIESRADEAYKKTLLYDSLIESSRQQSQPQYDPNDIPTIADVQRLTEQAVSRVETTARDREVQAMIEAAKKAHPDFVEKVKLAKQIAAENPGLDAAIMLVKNPALAAYQLGLTHPSVNPREAEKAAQKLKETVDKNLQSQSTLGKVGSGGGQDQRAAKMPEPGSPAFEAMIHKAKGY
jgi:hypothetical protein